VAKDRGTLSKKRPVVKALRWHHGAMMGDDAEQDLWIRSIAEEFKTIKRCQEQVESAKQEATDDSLAAQALHQRLGLIWPAYLAGHGGRGPPCVRPARTAAAVQYTSAASS
jgi:hypothetical protein